MSTLAEIEAAVVGLGPEELDELEALLRRLRQGHHREPDVAELARRNGFNPFPRAAGAAVTTELIRQICQDEGI